VSRADISLGRIEELRSGAHVSLKLECIFLGITVAGKVAVAVVAFQSHRFSTASDSDDDTFTAFPEAALLGLLGTIPAAAVGAVDEEGPVAPRGVG
jgi:hypothetical protein